MAEGKGLSRRCAVIGSPVSHSLSPVLHRAGYTHVGLDWEFLAYDVDVPALPAFVGGLRPPWRGLAITMPLKQAVLPLADAVRPVAALVGGANTLLVEPAGSKIVDNTDVPGIAAALDERGIRTVPRATILGGGATARSAVAALAGIADFVEVYVRNPARAAELLAVGRATGLPLRIRAWQDSMAALDAPLVVATTPAHVLDFLGPAVPAGPALLFDVVYDPWPTRLVESWQRRGGLVIGGLDLLVHQAVLQFRLMTGYDVPVDVLRRAGEDARQPVPGSEAGP